MLGPRLNTIHNVHFYMDVIHMIRAAILEGRLDTLRVEDISGEPNVEAPA
jgi:tRNA-guanine family transglycosylase